MSKVSYVTLSLLTSAFLFLSGCDKTKDPLPGKREALFLSQDTLKVDETLKYTKPVVSKAIDINEWPLSGGNSTHNMGAGKVGESALKAYFKTSLGKGGSDCQKLIGNLVSGGDVVFGNDATGVVSAVDGKTGKILWKTVTSEKGMESESLGTGIALEGNHLYVTTSFAEVICLEATTGKEIWRQKALSPIRTAPTASQGRLFVVTINNELMALDGKTGALLWSHAGI